MALRVVPMTLREANLYVLMWHRHHVPAVGHRWSIGVAQENGDVVGVAICGRPVARETSQYTVLEVNRVATDETKNACSMLYGACARIGKTMGFDSIQTAILKSEPGTSLRAAGWKLIRESAGGDWNCPKRGGARRVDQPMGPKQVWGKKLR